MGRGYSRAGKVCERDTCTHGAWPGQHARRREPVIGIFQLQELRDVCGFALQDDGDPPDRRHFLHVAGLDPPSCDLVFKELFKQRARPRVTDENCPFHDPAQLH